MSIIEMPFDPDPGTPGTGGITPTTAGVGYVPDGMGELNYLQTLLSGLTDQDLNTSSGVTFAAIIISGLTATKLVATDANKELVSVTPGVSLSFSGTALNTIQNIRTADSPTFTGLTLSGLTASVPVVTDGSKALGSMAFATFKTNLAIAQADVSGLTTASSPVFAGLTLTAFSGIVKATAGVLSAAALADADIPNDITLTNITQITNRSHTSLSDIGTTTHATIDSYLTQAVTATSTVSFATLSLIKADAAGPGLYFYNNTGNTGADQVSGTIKFFVHNGSIYGNVAQIVGTSDATMGSGDNPGRLGLYTTPDGSGTPAERIRITNAGLVNIVTDAGLGLVESGGSYYLRLKNDSGLTADKTLTINTGNADRTVTLSGNPTLNDWFDQAVKTTSSPTFAAVTNTQKRNSMARGSLTGDQTGVADFAWRKVNINGEEFDIGSNFDTGNYRYVVPVTGYYQVNYRIAISNAGTVITVASPGIYVNGSIYHQGAGVQINTGAVAYGRLGGSCIVYATAGQYIELYCYIDTSDSSSCTFKYATPNSAGCTMDVILVTT